MTPPQADSEWIQVEDLGPYVELFGPVYMRMLDARTSAGEIIRFGFHVQPKHCNLSGGCSGGMLASFLDIALARTGILSRGYEHRTPTISLQMDFLQPARVDEWIESRAKLIHSSQRMGFCDATLVGPRGPVMRGSGIFRITSGPYM
ncbi:MAG: hypothetical protein JWQ90_2509 [Hydrocarboniphaga sp.]|uniref:PaaI family thioesterase n=1 Tax=Hydrocarboniphaga sp. TaxID=2033016 RepID=UPI00260FB2FF|nr:PaaI family thioesterase [Hydrocarboniphaga sp.]MDB5970059.1 hypothetical protein [Hydrocarboniphaga sp.]